ncbi:uncharacterized protein LOC125759032 [Rhipicephalus sanguineus]|uniref:uncharacterized protein LOC125759032 n=1 Tax=Rhipicephalus sanguineus TaxID=34632 RepID=UPI0020C55B0D|nr:uncharacterized protein LOC125759032 [Rhipicephalus sanguineus]
MNGSDGAAIAAHAGRGNRITVEDDKNYEIVLPTLPTGRIVQNMLFLHGDVRERPYRVEDFRDALVTAGVLPDVVALGAYQINHVWAVTLNTGEATKKLAALKELKVKGRRCVIFDPEDQQVKLRLHWLLYGVQDEDIRTAFAAFGNVTEVTRERWRVQGMREKGSTTRSVLLKLKPGLKVDDLPHQVRVAGELAVVVVPGRAMQCLRCHGTGHVRRDCKVPRCSKCRRYGHADADCVRTYASATGLPRADEHDEIMDVAEAEEAASGTDESGKRTGPLDTAAPCGGNAPQGDVPEQEAAEDSTGSKGNQPTKQVLPASSGADTRTVPVPTHQGAPGDFAGSSDTTEKGTESSPATKCGEQKNQNEPKAEKGGVQTPTNAAAASKRPHPQTCNVGTQGTTPGVEEPPAKTAQVRRSSLRPRPNVSSDRRGGNAEPDAPVQVPPPDGTAGDGNV